MPPKTVFTREQVIETAYQIMKAEGKEGITARNVAKKMDSSVGPIYTCFQNMEELQSEVIQRSADLLGDYMNRQWTEISFLNMGVGYVCFARDEPVLFRELNKQEVPDDRDGPAIPENSIRRMRGDSTLSDLSDDDLKDLYIKMSYFAYGMATMASQEGLPDVSTDYIINILQEAGGDLIFMARVRSISKDPKNLGQEIAEMMEGEK